MSSDWPIPQTFGETMRQSDRRLQSEERRPQLRKASDFLGPGFGPQAIHTTNWNGEECLFNGFFYSEPGALGAPDVDLAWIGQVIADPSPSGVQIVQTYRSPNWPPFRRMRKFETPAGGTAPIFTDWIGI